MILAPAAADILQRIGAGDSVVGVTNNVAGFPSAARVGTHLTPGIERIVALHPTLVITAAGFDPGMVRRMGAEHFVYDPETLDEIIQHVRILAAKVERAEAGEALAASLETILKSLREPPRRPTALYETRSAPLAIARDNTIILDILDKAGLRYAYPESAGIISAEYLLANQPDFYIYQEGPMNRNPLVPHQRPGWDGFEACAWKVDEFSFARPNTKVFDTVLQLNRILNSPDPCTTGTQFYGE